MLKYWNLSWFHCGLLCWLHPCSIHSLVAFEGHLQHQQDSFYFFKLRNCWHFFYQQMISQSVSGPGLCMIKSRAGEERGSILCCIQPPSVWRLDGSKPPKIIQCEPSMINGTKIQQNRKRSPKNVRFLIQNFFNFGLSHYK